MSLIIPFNFQPTSTSPKSGSYTIPSGFYAVVKPMCGDMLINAERIGNVESGSFSTAVAGSAERGIVKGLSWYTGSINVNMAGAGSTLYIQSIYSGVKTDMDRATGAIGFITIFFNTLLEGINLGTQASAGTTNTVNYTLYSTPDIDPFWVKSGDVLSGTRYIVTLYPEIT